MAVLAITNTLFYHAESLADIEALGSDDGIVADTIAWVEGTKSFYYPNVISAATTTWTIYSPGVTDNIYLADGTLDGARSVAFGSNDLTFSGAGGFVVNNTAKFLQDTPAIGEVATATGVDGSWTWQPASGGGGILVQVDQTLTTGSLSASGGTTDLNITSFINEGLIIDLQVTRTAGSGGDDVDVEIYTEDTYTNRIYFAEAADATTKFRDSSGIFYEDLDTSTELHIRITNQSAAAATFDVRARAQGEN